MVRRPAVTLLKWRALSLSRDRILPWLRALAWEWVGLVITLAGALALFAKIGEDVFDHESGTFDGVVRDWIVAHRTRLGTEFFTGVTRAGGTVPMLVLATLAATWLWVARRRHIAAAIVLAATASVGTFAAIKAFFGRVRPVGAAAFLHRTTYSFPSGHATGSAAVLGCIGYTLWRERVASGRLVIGVGTLAVLLIGLSRVYLDLHWATDVLGGWCLGLGVAAASAGLYEHWRPRETLGNPETVRVPMP